MTKPTTIITGGGQGIGRATAQWLAVRGHRVVVWEAEKKAGEELAEQMDEIHFIHCDVSEESAIKQAAGETVKRYGIIHHLVNNAATDIRKPLAELTLNEWNKVIATNLTGTLLCAKYCEPYLRKTKGAIVNLCSTRAHMSEPDTESYAATKGGILALTHALAISLGPDIRVNCISPGWINVTGYQYGGEAEEYPAKDHQQHPVGRIGKPADVAAMIHFLLSEESGFITGQEFVIDGGMTRKMIYV